ncbi:hypothetical protein EJB05_55049, partial [Eragrostis curvula]
MLSRSPATKTTVHPGLHVVGDGRGDYSDEGEGPAASGALARDEKPHRGGGGLGYGEPQEPLPEGFYLNALSQRQGAAAGGAGTARGCAHRAMTASDSRWMAGGDGVEPQWRRRADHQVSPPSTTAAEFAASRDPFVTTKLYFLDDRKCVPLSLTAVQLKMFLTVSILVISLVISSVQDEAPSQQCAARLHQQWPLQALPNPVILVYGGS